MNEEFNAARNEWVTKTVFCEKEQSLPNRWMLGLEQPAKVRVLNGNIDSGNATCIIETDSESVAIGSGPHGTLTEYVVLEGKIVFDDSILGPLDLLRLPCCSEKNKKIAIIQPSSRICVFGSYGQSNECVAELVALQVKRPGWRPAMSLDKKTRDDDPYPVVCDLLRDDRAGSITELVAFHPGRREGLERHASWEELIIISGECWLSGNRLLAGDYAYHSPGDWHGPQYTTYGTLFLAHLGLPVTVEWA